MPLIKELHESRRRVSAVGAGATVIMVVWQKDCLSDVLLSAPRAGDVTARAVGGRGGVFKYETSPLDVASTPDGVEQLLTDQCPHRIVRIELLVLPEEHAPTAALPRALPGRRLTTTLPRA